MKTSLKKIPAQKTESNVVAAKPQGSVPRGTLDKPQQADDWRGVFFRGPASRRDKQGEEQPDWVVYLGDGHGDPIRTVYHVHDFTRAEALAAVMAEDRKLTLIAEAMPA